MKKGKKYSGLPISDLPTYTPPESLWNEISESLDEKLSNKNQPIKNELQRYEPPAGVWKKIDSSLNFQKQISSIPVHVPPDFIWNEIENSLAENGIPKRRNFKPLLKWAASILLIAAIAGVVNLLQPDAVELEYHVEWEQANETIDISPGISGYDMIAKLCARSKEICDTPDFIRLENELSELEKARDEVKSQMNPYGDNNDLERMLMRIEMEHAEIMKQMASSLL